MRPVNKGDDLGVFNPYTDAQQRLIERLGEYCSYCERWIASGIHVEHKLPKNNYPEYQFIWTNFLLSCTNCNSGKGHGTLNIGDYLWPDSDNTYLAFVYDAEGRVLVSNNCSDEIIIKAFQSWKMFGLNKHPDTAIANQIKPTAKDLRWKHRSDAWRKATRYKMQLLQYDSPERREDIVEMALERGFWSVWMTVFHDDIDMRQRLINAFKGTSTDCFDADTQPIPRPSGQL